MSALVPVFPLNSVLFPGGLLPLRIFETRYLDMVSRCLREDCGFVVALIKEGSEIGGGATVYSTGTLTKITDWDSRTDGLLGITAQGKTKVNIGEISVTSDHLMNAVVEPQVVESHREVPPEFESLVTLLDKILAEIGSPFDQYEPQLNDSSWVSSRLTEFLPIPLQHKQELLEMDDPLSRLHGLYDQMLELKIV